MGDQVKEFGPAKLIDYFELKENNKGIRKKVYPMLTGKYQVNDAIQEFRLIEKPDIGYLLVIKMNK